MWMLDISDRLILNAFVGPQAVGVYTLGYKMSSIFNIILLGPINLFWTPFIFSYSAQRGEEAMRRVSEQAFSAFALIGSLTVVGISVGVNDLIHLFTHNADYYRAIPIVPFLLIAPFLYLLSYPLGSAILQSKQVRFSSYAMLAAAVLNVALNLVLVPRFSLFGATATTVAGYAVLFGLSYLWAQRVFPARYDVWLAIKIIGSAAVSILVTSAIEIDAPVLSLIVRETVAVAIFGGLAWLVGGFRLADVRHRQSS